MLRFEQEKLLFSLPVHMHISISGAPVHDAYGLGNIPAGLIVKMSSYNIGEQLLISLVSGDEVLLPDLTLGDKRSVTCDE